MYASQAGRKVMGREAGDLAVASFGGSSKLWRPQEALETAVSSGSVSKFWRRQRALETAASSGDGSALDSVR